MNLSFVLVGTTHAGNIGAAARAIKTMGFHDLRLVDTCRHRTADAIARASGANDILDNAPRFDTLDEALADCHISYGTTARDRHLAAPVVTAREAADQMMTAYQSAQQSDQPDTAIPDTQALQMAVVFGRERSGLSNEELDRCNRLLRIPCNPDFSSLNLGSAVQVVAYEAAQARLLGQPDASANPATAPRVTAANTGVAANDAASQVIPDASMATGEAMQYLFEHLERVMLTTGFLDPGNPRQLLRRVRQYFERTRPTDIEMNILRGFLSSVEKPRRRGGGTDRTHAESDI